YSTSGPFDVAASSIITLPPGASKDLTVVFEPIATGAQSGMLTITSNDPAQPTVSVTLSGNGAAPASGEITVSPETLDFQTIPVGQSKDAKFTISNTGQGSLKILSVSAGANSPFRAAFSPLSLAAGKSSDVAVTFQPTASGARQGTLTILSDDPLYP